MGATSVEIGNAGLGVCRRCGCRKSTIEGTSDLSSMSFVAGPSENDKSSMADNIDGMTWSESGAIDWWFVTGDMGRAILEGDITLSIAGSSGPEGACSGKLDSTAG
jgi:hypothetical protein